MEDGWTEERVEKLKALWADGKSCSQVAAILGHGITRNAVIGKVHRLNLPPRGSTRIAETRAKTKRKPSMPKLEQSQTALVPANATPPRPRKPRAAGLSEPKPLVKGHGRVRLMDLSDSTCKWPIGHVGAEDFCFCGHTPRAGSSYCEYHARLAYQSVTARKAEVDAYWAARKGAAR